MFEHIGTESSTRITLYTDAHVVRGDLRTRQRRLTDVLNATDASFLVLDNVIFEDFGVRAVVERAAYAQINLATILFAVAEAEVEPTPELRMAKVPEKATVSVPPFKITGRIHLLPERDLHERAGGADRPLPAHDRGGLLVRLPERGAHAGAVPGRSTTRVPRSWRRSRSRTCGPASWSARPSRPSAAADGSEPPPRLRARPQRSTGRSSRLPQADQPPS